MLVILVVLISAFLMAYGDSHDDFPLIFKIISILEVCTILYIGVCWICHFLARNYFLAEKNILDKEYYYAADDIDEDNKMITIENDSYEYEIIYDSEIDTSYAKKVELKYSTLNKVCIGLQNKIIVYIYKNDNAKSNNRRE